MRRQAGLEDFRLHDCRHSYASRALVLGEGLPATGRLLGHRKVMTTARYAHLARDSEKAAAAKRVTMGRHGIVTAEEARRRAALIIARIKAGEEPVAEPAARVADGPTVTELARLWLDKRVAVRCKAKTAYTCRLAVDKHIAPTPGSMPALAVGHAEVTQLHHALRGRPVMANRAVDVLSRIYSAAGDRGRIPEAFNPCRRVVKYRERARERFLSDAEFRRLGRVLDEAETRKGVSAHAVAAIRRRLLTGCRKGEILNLRWSEVDMEANELRLPDTRTGPRTIVLPAEAAGVLAAIPRGRAIRM